MLWNPLSLKCPRNSVKGLIPKARRLKNDCGRERWRTERVTKKEGEDEKLGGFGIPLLFRIELRRQRAHKPRTCKYTRVNAEGMRRSYVSDCWPGTNINMVGATLTYGTMEGGCSFLPHFSFRGKTTRSSIAFPTPPLSLLRWFGSWCGGDRGPSLDWIISSESFY